MVEQMLRDLEHAYGLNSICLRYFNAAGADPEGELGERHTPETHLIPLILQVASRRRDNISIFGTDYDTPDGTCIRDYIHVQDLCSAHLLAMESLVNGGSSQVYNIGNGQGYSNRNVIETVKTVTKKQINVLEMPRRDGDSARLVADSKRLQADLGWKPKYPDLDTIILHAWNWEQKHNWNLIK
jgi:UDP-glucose 4-epimerase